MTNDIETTPPRHNHLELKLDPQEYLENADTVYLNLLKAVVVPTETPGMDVVETGALSQLENLQLIKSLKTLEDITVIRESSEGTNKLAVNIAACFRSLAIASPQRIPIFFKGYKKVTTKYPDESLTIFLEETEPTILYVLEHYPDQIPLGKGWVDLVEEYKASRNES